MSKSVDISGRKFGRLQVLKRAGEKNTHALWEVRCECGKVLIVPYSNLVSGNTTQCKRCYGDTLKVISEEIVKKMLSARADGMTYREIALEFGYPVSTTFNTIKREINSKSKT